MNVSINVILDTRRIKKLNKYPVKLRVTFKRVADDYQTVVDLSKDEFDKLEASRITRNLLLVRDQLREIKRTAQNAAVKLDPFTFTEFERKFILGHPLFRQRKANQPDISNQRDEFN